MIAVKKEHREDENRRIMEDKSQANVESLSEKMRLQCIDACTVHLAFWCFQKEAQQQRIAFKCFMCLLLVLCSLILWLGPKVFATSNEAQME